MLSVTNDVGALTFSFMLSILYLRCAWTPPAGPQLPVRFTFNSLFEMQRLVTQLVAQYHFKYFQFSI